MPFSNARAASTCWWLVDPQDFFQLELFQFRSPKARELPVDWRPCDIGYTTIGVHVDERERRAELLQRLRGCARDVTRAAHDERTLSGEIAELVDRAHDGSVRTISSRDSCPRSGSATACSPPWPSGRPRFVASAGSCRRRRAR